MMFHLNVGYDNDNL